MEIGLSKSSHLQWVNDTPEEDRDHLRSYRCSFCKRGFSNAQALGGHMNIHRKDRAKLKSVFSMDEHHHHNTVSMDSGIGGSHEHHQQLLQYSEINEDCIFSDKLQLTLSVKSSSPPPESYSGGSSRNRKRNMKQLSSHGGASAELDLDLHL